MKINRIDYDYYNQYYDATYKRLLYLVTFKKNGILFDKIGVADDADDR